MSRSRQLVVARILALLLALSWWVSAWPGVTEAQVVETSATGPAPGETDAGRGWLGFRFQLARDGEALRVRALVAGAAAERAGLEPGDLVLAFNGVDFRFTSRHEVGDALAWIGAGDRLLLTVERAGTLREVRLVADPIPERLLDARRRHHDGRDAQAARQIDAMRALYRELGSDSVVLDVHRGEDGELSARPRRPLALESEILPEILGLSRFEWVRALGAGDTIALEVRRDGRRLVVEPWVESASAAAAVD